MVMMNREKVEVRGVAEPCGGGAISVEWVWGDGALVVGTEADAEGEGEGPSTVAVRGAGAWVGVLFGGGEEESVITVTLSFWPLLQWPEKGQEK